MQFSLTKFFRIWDLNDGVQKEAFTQMITLPWSQKGPKAQVGLRALDGSKSQCRGIIKTLLYVWKQTRCGVNPSKNSVLSQTPCYFDIDCFCLNDWDKCLLGPLPFASKVLACNGSKYWVMGKNENEPRMNEKETRKEKILCHQYDKMIFAFIKSLKFLGRTTEDHLKLLQSSSVRNLAFFLARTSVSFSNSHISLLFFL